MPKKIPLLKFPKTLEVDYSIKLRKLINYLFQNTTKYIIPRIKDFKNKYEFDVKVDAYGQDINNTIQELTLINSLREEEIIPTITAEAQAVEANNLIQLSTQATLALGINPFVTEPYLFAKRESFIARNISSIQSIPEQYHRQLQTILVTGIESGISTTKISENIRNLYGVTRRRATLIAVDQIGKYFGELTKVRSEYMGVKKFRWRTSRDERVRAEHRAREGKIYSWKKGADGELPGVPIRCRCVAQNIYED